MTKVEEYLIQKGYINFNSLLKEKILEEFENSLLENSLLEKNEDLEKIEELQYVIEKLQYEIEKLKNENIDYDDEINLLK